MSNLTIEKFFSILGTQSGTPNVIALVVGYSKNKIKLPTIYITTLTISSRVRDGQKYFQTFRAIDNLLHPFGT